MPHDTIHIGTSGWVIADSGTRFASGEAITAKHIYLQQ
jgi:hypothetical protein